MTLTERIDQILKERNMSRRKLATLAKIPTSTLQSAMERNGSMSFEMLRKIATALEIPLALLTVDPEMADLYKQIELELKSFEVESADEKTEDQERKKLLEAKKRALEVIVESNYYTEDIDNQVIDLIAFELDKLNEKGQQVAVERIRELAKIPDYLKKD